MRTLLLTWILACSAIPAWGAATEPSIRRFALVASSENGGPGRALLRYAKSDANAIAKVMRELGGVSPADTLVLLDTDRASLQSGIATLAARLAEAKQAQGRLELLVYYSGHSDEEGLLLRSDKVSYADLRKMLDKLPADVRIAILDSCASGAFTRQKGGKQKAPFLLDVSAKVKGHAFLTSSSADEASQESDAIAASYFTHALVSGLRGAADFNHDSRVTLNEAYQFAFNETLARTERTRGGAQHAAYDIQLSGAGDLVLTDLRQTAAALVLDEALRGRVFIRDAAGNLVVELNKFPGRSVDLGLDPGRYRVVVGRDKQLFEAYVELLEGQQALLSDGQLVPIKAELTALRGAAGGVTTAADVALLKELTSAPPPKKYKVVPANALILPRVSTEGLEGEDEINYFSFNFLAGHAARLQGAEVSLGFNSRSEAVRGAQIAYAGNFAGMGWWSNPGALGEVSGAQVAFGFNAARGRVTGNQTAFGFNGAAGHVSGAQLVFGANSARSFRGAQIAFGANLAGLGLGKDSAAALTAPPAIGTQIAFGGNYAERDAKGVQLAFGANVARGRVYGMQQAFAANYAGHVTGAQISYAVNVARGITGAQVAFAANLVKGEIKGFQGGYSANVVNGNVTGVQASAGANVTSGYVRGLQIGAFNYNHDITGAAIGIVSISRNRPVRLQAWGSDVAPFNLAVKHGSKYVYNFLSGGVQPFRELQWSAGWGIGAEVPLKRWFFDADGSVSLVRIYERGARNAGLAQLRILAGYRFAKRFAVIAGPTFNSRIEPKDPSTPLLDLREKDFKDQPIRNTKGFLIGVEI